MANYRLIAPVIRWGTNLANAVYFPFPLDSVFSGEDPRAGSSFLQAPSGFEDSWYVGTDYTLAGVARWLQQADTLFYPRCTGWDGTLGIRAALNSMRQKNTFSWHPDGRNLLRFPLLTTAAVGSSVLSGWVGNTQGSTSGVTIAFDAGTGAWKIVGTATAINSYVQLQQYVPAIPGEVFCLSADYKVSGLGTGATGQIWIDALDASQAYISTPGGATGLTATVFTRATSGAVSVMPALSAFASISLRLNLPSIGSTGTIWFKNTLLRRDSTDNTFIDNPSVDGCYLVDPMAFAPLWETDGSRQLALKMRNPSTPFDGY